LPRLANFQQLHPLIQVNIISNEVAGPQAGDATLWIRYGKGPWPGFSATTLPIAVSLGVVCAPELLQRFGPIQHPSDLLDKPLLSYTGGSLDLWQDFFAHFRLPPSTLDQSRRFQQLFTLAQAAMSGLGFAVVPLFLMEPELASGRLVVALPQTFESERQHYLLCPQGAQRDKKIQLFKRWILNQARQSATASNA
jgi:LysR family glycine cleavage system transcriptional activator